MNWFKWFICWYNKQHIFTRFIDKQGNSSSICVRCGYVKESNNEF